MAFLDRHLGDWTDQIPTGDRLYGFVAAGIIVAAVLGNVLFVGFSIVPQWRTRNQLASEVARAHHQLEVQREEKSADRLEEQLVAARDQLEQAASVFFSESEAADVLGRLYRYADERGVEIVTLEGSPDPKSEENSVYDVRTFRLQAVGTVPALVDFVSHIREAASKTFQVDNVNIAEGEHGHSLTLGFALYTSSYSSGAAAEPAPDTSPTATSKSVTELTSALEAAWNSHDWQEAIELVQQIAAIDPHHGQLQEKLYAAYVNYGYELLETGDTSRAATQFDLALGIRPDGEEALAGLQQVAPVPTPTLTAEGRLTQRLGAAWAEANWEEVIDLLKQLKELNPADDGLTEKLYAAYVNHGYALAAERRFEEAKEALTRALTIRPEGGEAAAGLERLAGGSVPQMPTLEPEYLTHVVEEGENLFRISLQYSTTVEAIMAANALAERQVYVGQQLKIPAP